MSKKQDKYSSDPGHTIVNLDFEGSPYGNKNKKNDIPRLTSKEKFHLIMAQYAMLLPKLLIVVLSFVLATLFLAYVWLG